jgi:mono/diheme cytochrome c family protein
VVIRIPKLQTQPIQQASVWIVFGILVVTTALLTRSYFNIADPYTSDVLSLSGDTTIGHAIFQTNCAGCHGLDAGGRVGPSLYGVSQRKSPARIVEQVTSGNTPPMPQFKPNTQEMADLLSYLETL